MTNKKGRDRIPNLIYSDIKIELAVFLKTKTLFNLLNYAWLLIAEVLL